MQFWSATERLCLQINYIWDFYTEGSTSMLLKKILKFPRQKKIIVYFIGYKAGLLESLPELKKTIEHDF